MKTVRWMIAGAVLAALVGCGAEEIASPGTGGNINIDITNNNAPPATDPGETPTGVQPAAGCPALNGANFLTDSGTVTGPTGTYRVCVLPTRFTADATLNRIPGLLYAIDGRVDVGYDQGPTEETTDPADVTLTIRPGVIIFARAQDAWLAVNRGNRINAVGSVTKPIVFTSLANVRGEATDNTQKQWGGVVLMGRAPITDCAADVAPGTVACERQTEGATDPALFGGATPDDDSGTLDYVQIRYSGYPIGEGVELQSLTLEGTGSGTIVRHIHSHNSSDDGFEIFGGRTPLRWIVVTGADDDTIDVDTGYQGTIQFVLGIQRPYSSSAQSGDSVIELDTSYSSGSKAQENQTPRTKLKLANFTLIHNNLNNGAVADYANAAAFRFRGGADATLINGIVVSGLNCGRLDGGVASSATAALAASPGVSVLGATDGTIQKDGPVQFHSVALQCNVNTTSGTSGAFRAGSSGITAAAAQAQFDAGTNNNAAFVSTFTGAVGGSIAYTNGTAEGPLVAANPTTVSGGDAAFTNAAYVGAVTASDTWHQGWTCNSGYANFGTTSSSCTTLPSLAD